jgi:hypothetical protein
MKTHVWAIETSGIVDSDGVLRLDETLADLSGGRVRVIVRQPDDGDIDETEWFSSAASNSAFDFLADPVEDIYSLKDGKPFNDEG